MGKPQESDTGQFCALPASVLSAPAPQSAQRQPAQRQLISRRKEIAAMLHVRIDLIALIPHSFQSQNAPEPA
ncbi:hypothetical protein BZA02_103208 [Ruegeria sp. P4]|nr:hypothetical protein BZA02_103208 [Ruegeria sp. P4]